MAPPRGRRGPAKGRERPLGSDQDARAEHATGRGRGDNAARRLRALAAEAERDRSDPREQTRLLRRVAGGDAESEERLFHENLAMVLRLAHAAVKADGSGLSEDELLQEGALGLIAAIKGFADAGQDDFQTYAEAQTRAAIDLAQMGDEQLERDKAQLVADAEAYERAEISIRRLKGREATLEELAEKLEWSKSKTARLGVLVDEARRAHDEELLAYIDPAELSEFEDE